MRPVTAFLVLLLAPAALAQPCDPSTTDDVCPDTTDWHRYFPLEVGNVWQYRDAFYDEPTAPWSWTIIGQTEVEGQTYFELERCDEGGDGSAACAEPVLIRYDDEHALLIRRTDSGEAWWDELPCSMAADFNSEQACTGPALEATTVAVPPGQYGASVVVPPDVVSGDTDKRFDWQFVRGWRVFAGLGLTEFHYELQGEPTRLVYANVGGEQVGTPAFASCDPTEADDVVCPDTTDWRRYFPLAVGNEWQYREVLDVGEEVYWGWRITEAVEIEGRTYFEIERCDADTEGTVMCGELVPVRYSDDHARVVQYANGGDTWWGLHCDLALPFGGVPQTESGFYECSDFGPDGPLYLGSEGSYGASVTVGPDVLLGDTRKHIGTPIFTGTTYYAGLGPVEYVDEYHPEATRLVYARVDSEVFGEFVFVFPTSSEPEGGQPEGTAFTDVFPNPARGTLRAQYALDAPQSVTLELIDLLGRRVRSAEGGPQPAGTHDVQFDLGGLRAGLYVLRLRGDAGAEAARRIVVVR